MQGIFINDGYTRKKTIPAEAGFYPEVTVVFRPALYEVRAEYETLVTAGDHARRAKFGSELLARQVVELNGQKITAEDARRLVPNLRAAVTDLVLGYAGSDEEAKDQSKSPTG